MSQITFAPFSQEGEGPGGKLAKTLTAEALLAELDAVAESIQGEFDAAQDAGLD